MSKHKLERTEPGIVLGKLQYMSPEQARGEQIDRKTDIFATGILLYELLTGERYYDGLFVDDVWRRAGTGAHVPRRLAELPIELRDIVQRACAARAEARFSSCADFAAAVHDYQARRRELATAAELRAFMRTLFGNEEQEDRRTRAALSAQQLVSAAVEQEQSVRFAVAPRSASPAVVDTEVSANPFLAQSEDEVTARQPVSAKDGIERTFVVKRPAPEQTATDLVRTRERRGLGIGLYITRQIVEAHGGEIRVQSEVGAGARFTIALPLATAPAER
jgi:serine/threonine protein kinase